jgi:hypothetical protein
MLTPEAKPASWASEGAGSLREAFMLPAACKTHPSNPGPSHKQKKPAELRRRFQKGLSSPALKCPAKRDQDASANEAGDQIADPSGQSDAKKT